MLQMNIYEAKTRLSELVEHARNGETVIIAKAGEPLVRMIPYKSEKRPLKFGLLKGKIRESDDFDAPLPDDIQAAFEGRADV